MPITFTKDPLGMFLSGGEQGGFVLAVFARPCDLKIQRPKLTAREERQLELLREGPSYFGSHTDISMCRKLAGHALVRRKDGRWEITAAGIAWLDSRVDGPAEDAAETNEVIILRALKAGCRRNAELRAHTGIHPSRISNALKVLSRMGKAKFERHGAVWSVVE